MPGVVKILSWRDIPGRNHAGCIIPSERPLLAVDKVNHYGEAIAAIVAESPECAEDALEKIEIEYKPLPVISDPLTAMTRTSIKIHEKGNIFRHFKILKGKIEEGFRQSEIVIENTFRTQLQDGMPLEPEAGFAMPEENGGVTVIASIQNLYDIHESIVRILDLSPEKVRVIQSATGGGFGPKSDDSPIQVCGLVALAAYKTGRPSALVYDRDESMITHSKKTSIHYS
jgi:CO/xanthine dehydrogenase Mo-binding subunit